MSRMLRALGAILFILLSPAALAAVFQSTTQAGLNVEFDAAGNYALYVDQSGQPAVLEIGTFQVAGDQLTFTPSQSVTGNLQPSSATLSDQGCAFTWGEAGRFQSTETGCQGGAGQTSYDHLISMLKAENLLLTIPQMGLPNASGGFDIYKLTLELISLEPVQFKVVGLEPVANPENALSAIFYPQQSFLYLPVMGVDFGGGQLLALYEYVLQIVSAEPLVLQEFQAFQAAPPQASPATPGEPDYSNYDPAVIQMLSDMSRMSHDTSMSIISNMDDTSCYGYEYQCR